MLISESGAQAPSRRHFLKSAGIGAAPPRSPRRASSRRRARSPCAGRAPGPRRTSSTSSPLDYAKKVNDMTGGDLADRGAARRRGRARLRPARRRLGGHARRRPRRDRLSLRQADGAGAVGLGPRLRRWTPTCCWRGTNTAAARSCSRSSTSRSAPTSCRSPTDRCRRSRSAGSRSPSPTSTTLNGLQVPHRRHLDRRVHRHGRRGQRAAGRRDRRGDGPRPARRGRVQQRLVRPDAWASPTCRRSACCRATTRTPSSSRSCSTRPSTTRCPTRSRRSSPTRSRRPRRTCSWKAIDRYSTDYARDADRGRRRVLQDPRRHPPAPARGLRRGRQEEGGGQSAVQGDPRLADRLRQRRARGGNRTRWSNRRMAFDHYFGENAAADTL